MNAIDSLRVYQPDECGVDGYPLAWHRIDGGPGIKHLVRSAAGDRCLRCSHPYAKGAGEWSPCDEQCQHGGVYPFEHSDWFKPYAAGWYAWTYLREEIQRDEAIARMDELLALERIA